MIGVIRCGDTTDFLDTIEGLVRRGLIFEADAGTMLIKLLPYEEKDF